MFDSSGRSIHYLRVSVTDRCNLRCVYCMPEEGVASLPHAAIISFERIREVVAAAVELGFDKVRLTGGEPLVRKGLPELVSMLRPQAGLRVLAMTTNGTLLAPLAAELKARGLDSVNISLDTLDPGRYAELTRGGRLADALAGVDAALAAGLPVKLNVVRSDGDADRELARIRAYAENLGAAVQVIRRYRLDSAKTDDARFERPPACFDCNRIRLLATGRLKPCLHSDLEIPVDYNDIKAGIAACVAAKPARGEACAGHALNAIGG